MEGKKTGRVFLLPLLMVTYKGLSDAGQRLCWDGSLSGKLWPRDSESPEYKIQTQWEQE